MIFQWHVRGGEASDDLFLYNCNGIILQNLVNVDLFWSIGFSRIGIVLVLSKMIFQVWKNPLYIKCFLNHCWRWPKYKIQNILVIIFCKKQLYTILILAALCRTAEPLSYCGQTCKSNLDSTLNDAKVLGLSNVFIHCLSELKRFSIQNIIKVYFISSCHYWPEVIKQH